MSTGDLQKPKSVRKARKAAGKNTTIGQKNRKKAPQVLGISGLMQKAAQPVPIPAREISESTRNKLRQLRDEAKAKAVAAQPTESVLSSAVEFVQPVRPDLNPEALLQHMLALPHNDCPSVLCLDARQTAFDRVAEWLEQFDAVINEQYELPPAEVAEAWFPQLAVLLSLDPQPTELWTEWKSRMDIDWIETEATDEAASLYLHELRESLGRFVARRDHWDLPAAQPNSNLVPYLDTLSDSDKVKWQNAMENLEASYADEDES